MGFRTLYNTDGSLLNDVIIGARDEREVPRLASGTVISFGKQLGKRVGIELGIGYAQSGWKHKVDLDDVLPGDLVDPRRGFIYVTDGAIPTKATFTDVLHYLEVPLGVTAHFGRGKVRSVSVLGIAPAFLVAARGTTVYEYPDDSKEDTRYKLDTDLHTFNCFAFLSTGLALRLGKLVEWRLQPTVRYGLLDVVDAPITAKVYSATVDLGVRITL